MLSGVGIADYPPAISVEHVYGSPSILRAAIGPLDVGNRNAGGIALIAEADASAQYLLPEVLMPANGDSIRLDLLPPIGTSLL